MSKANANRVELAPMTEQETWDAAVAAILGPRLVSENPDERRANALQLAAAALRAAGEPGLATNVLEAGGKK